MEPQQLRAPGVPGTGLLFQPGSMGAAWESFDRRSVLAGVGIGDGFRARARSALGFGTVLIFAADLIGDVFLRSSRTPPVACC
jgi:hypothetical protein